MILFKFIGNLLKKFLFSTKSTTAFGLSPISQNVSGQRRNKARRQSRRRMTHLSIRFLSNRGERKRTVNRLKRHVRRQRMSNRPNRHVRPALEAAA